MGGRRRSRDTGDDNVVIIKKLGRWWTTAEAAGDTDIVSFTYKCLQYAKIRQSSLL